MIGEGKIRRIISRRKSSYTRRTGRVKPHKQRYRINIKKKGIITPPYKKVFSTISTGPREAGGQIDFQRKGSIERFTTNIGGRTAVTPIVDEDFELGWHSHTTEGINVLPSPFDMAEMVKLKTQQAEIIFSNGYAIGIVKTPRANRLRNKSRKELEKYFNKLYLESQRMTSTPKSFINSVIKKLRDEGFHIFKVSKKQKSISIPIRIKE